MTPPPRLYLHSDRKYVSIGFRRSPDTLLKLGGQLGAPGEIDIERTERWCDAICELIDRADNRADNRWAAFTDDELDRISIALAMSPGPVGDEGQEVTAELERRKA